MDANRKRQLKNDYKRKPSVGAVYALDCSGSHRRWIKSTSDIGGIKNRFSFAKNMGGCPDPVALSDWLKYGQDSITLTVLEELQMKEDQTSREFADELKLLLEMWVEKSASGGQVEGD